MSRYIKFAAFLAALTAIAYVVIFINGKSFSSVIAGLLIFFAFILIVISNIISIKKIRDE